MYPKERVLESLSHRQTDRVPVDYWSTEEVDRRLSEYMGVPNRGELLEALGIDIRYVFPPYIGPPLRTFSDGSREDIWGVRRKKLIAGSAIYSEVCYSPLSEMMTPGELDDFPWPEPECFDYSQMATLCDKYKNYAVITVDERTNRTTVLHEAIYLCGMEKIMMDLALNPLFVHKLFGKITAFYTEVNRRILQAGSGKIDILLIGDDFGTQNNLIVSSEMLRRFIFPYLKKYIDLCKEYKVRVMFHSCGAIKEIIPDLIELGIEILNPIQVRAEGMVPSELKNEFGDRLCFHGGLDIQQTLPRGKPDDVRNEVRERIEVLGKNGGYILAPTHNFQEEVPLENIIAFYQEAGSMTEKKVEPVGV